MEGYMVLIEKFVFTLSSADVTRALEEDKLKGVGSEFYVMSGSEKKQEVIRHWAMRKILEVAIPDVSIMPLIDDARVNITRDGAQIITHRFR